MLTKSRISSLCAQSYFHAQQTYGFVDLVFFTNEKLIKIYCLDEWKTNKTQIKFQKAWRIRVCMCTERNSFTIISLCSFCNEFQLLVLLLSIPSIKCYTFSSHWIWYQLSLVLTNQIENIYQHVRNSHLHLCLSSFNIQIKFHEFSDGCFFSHARKCNTKRNSKYTKQYDK